MATKMLPLAINKRMQFDELLEKLLDAPQSAPATAPVRTPTKPAPSRPAPARPSPKPSQDPWWFPAPGPKPRPKAVHAQENEEQTFDGSIGERDKKILQRRSEKRKNILK